MTDMHADSPRTREEAARDEMPEEVYEAMLRDMLDRSEIWALPNNPY